MALKKWSDEEVEILKEYAFAPMREIVEMLPGRNRKTIYWKLSVLGFFRQTYARYSKEEDDYIKSNYQLLGNRAIAKKLKRTEKSITKRMIVLGFKRSDSELKVMRGKNNGCFKKGRSSEKTFFNGQLQLVYDSKADVSFYNIKIDGKFVRFSRYLYEQYNNVKLSTQDIIFHLDGNGMNVLKENLCRINRLELMKKNIDADDAFIKRIFRINNPEAIEFIKSDMMDVVNLKRNSIKLTKQIKQNEGKN